MTREFGLLLGCARVDWSAADRVALRGLVSAGVDWTVFVGHAIEHGVAALAGHGLVEVAPDLVPVEMQDAFGAMIEQTRRKNGALFDELWAVLEALAQAGVEALAFKGPVLALEAFGDVGLRSFRDLDFLIRDGDVGTTIGVLGRLGYERKGELSAAQYDLIHRLQGQEILFKGDGGGALEPHTRLVPLKMALDIDHAELWLRAERRVLAGRSLLILAPEDTVLVLAIHGGKELWWSLKWVCDVAAYLGSHPGLDWGVILERGRAQGCLRMVVLAAALARRCLGASVPDAVVALERSDGAIDGMVGRIVAGWQAEGPRGPPSNKVLSRDRLLLHDGVVRRARHAARTVLLPSPGHVAAAALPAGLSFAYVPLRLGNDVVMLPLLQAWRWAQAQAERLPAALAASDLAIALMPVSAETKRTIRHHRKLRAEAERALALHPNDAAAWRNLGNALAGLQRYKKAVACYDKALAFAPNSTTIWKQRADAMKKLGRLPGQPDTPVGPQDADAWAIQANRLFSTHGFVEAEEASDRALALDPRNVLAARVGIQARLLDCNWRRRADDQQRITQGLANGEHVVNPFYHRAICDSEAENLALAQLVSKGFARSPRTSSSAECYRHDKIRIAYLSTDFGRHVVSDAIAGCFEYHDKTLFEITAVALGTNDGSKMRRRIEAAFDRFIDAQGLGDATVAATLRELEIDVAIDLNGYSGEHRTAILARRPAPVQVNYLGYPGTMAAPFIDYILADPVVIPPENQIHYTEQVIYLPHSYMPTDTKRPVVARVSTRADAGLPAQGFVFVCHNHPHKIGPQIFDVWMRLLQRVEGSVLWLKLPQPSTMSNLRREAGARGVAPERLVFAPHVPRTEDYLAQFRLGDLFLDTTPYNAHVTACDALWAGLPVLTCVGNTFPGRVAASVLHAIGLQELVTASLTEYEAMALALAKDPDRHAAIKATLIRNRARESLFDTARFTRDLEAAFRTMYERQQAGLPPASFAVNDGSGFGTSRDLQSSTVAETSIGR